MPDAAHVVAAANATLPGYQQIREWLVWPDEDFPRTGTLKPRTGLILERVLEEREADGDPAAAAGRPTTIEDLLEQVAGRSGAGLSALGSLERVELMSALEDRFQVDLDESKFTSATTLEELGKLVTEPEARRTDLVYPRWVWRWPVTWIRSFVYFALTWPATEILSRPAIRGRERLTGSEGPALVVSNHVTYLDAGLVLAALPQRLRRLAIAMEGERVRRMRHPPREWSWWDRLTGWAGYWLMTPLFHVFPLPQQSGFRESFRFAGETADRGYSVLVFPEGMRTPDGEIHAFRSGTGLLAANLGLPVIPVRIHGLWELKSSGRRGFAPWGSIQIHIGDPLHFDRGVDPDEITRKLEAAVRAL
jgi:long-chain acyl-CoA synthetase